MTLCITLTDRFRLVCRATVLVLFLNVACLADADQPRAAPNVLFILADDLGWSDTTLYGGTQVYETPNIERLARRGLTFARAYSASPLCSPTRSAILTGLSPARTGITSPNCHLPQVVLSASVNKSAAPDQKAIQPNTVTRLKTDYRTLAEALQEAGYATGHFGKWHLGAEPYSPLQQGFDIDLPHHPGPGPAGSYVAPWKFNNFAAKTEGEHIEDRMAREAVSWMKQPRDRPFFLNYWMFSVHAPFDAKSKLIEKARARVKPGQRQNSPTYMAMIESMDDAVGTLLDGLDEAGLTDNTIVIFTSDNGGNMYSVVDDTVPTNNYPLRGGKASMYEGGTRVPCVISWPGVTQAGGRTETMIQSEDYYPTLLAGLGLTPAPNQRFDGVDVFPALRGAAFEHPAIFQYFPHSPAVPDWLPPSVSVHAGDWKLIRIFHGGNHQAHRYLLFDLKEDLSEQRDLSSNHPDKVRELDALIEGFLKDTQAVVPAANPAFDPSQYHPEDEGKAKPRQARASTQPAAASRDPGDNPQMLGWKTRNCTAQVADGVARVTSSGNAPFLGVAAGKLQADAKLRFRLKCAGGGGNVTWIPGQTAATNKENKPVEYMVKADHWTEISSLIPANPNQPGIIRLFLPVDQPVEIDWIELIQGDQKKRWDF